MVLSRVVTRNWFSYLRTRALPTTDCCFGSLQLTLTVLGDGFKAAKRQMRSCKHILDLRWWGCWHAPTFEYFQDRNRKKQTNGDTSVSRKVELQPSIERWQPIKKAELTLLNCVIRCRFDGALSHSSYLLPSLNEIRIMHTIRNFALTGRGAYCCT